MKKVFLLVLSALFVFACEKTPEEIAVSSVSLSQPSAEMIIGETLQLQVSISPSNATDKTVFWGSSKQSVATVSNTGLVSAVSEGSSTITVSAGGKSATCQITVSKGTVDVSSITLNETSIELIEGESKTLVATVLPEDATDKTVSWSSSAPDIASVNGGKVNALLPGEAIITATANNKSASCKVVVSKKVIAVESIELDKTELTLYEAETETLVATVKPDDATDKSVTWSSSNTAIATVEDGKVTAIKEGEASITAKAGEKSAICKVVVKHDTSNDAIVFAESKVKEVLVAAFDTNGDGELSYGEAAAVTSIEGVFYSLKTVEHFDEFQFFTGIKFIPSSCFQDWIYLKSIVLPPNVEKINSSAFSGCGSLEGELVIPSQVSEIAFSAFSGCGSIASISLPKTLKKIWHYAFKNCAGIKKMDVEDIDSWLKCSIEEEGNPLYLNGGELYSNGKLVTNINFPSDIKTIGQYQLTGCSSITSITIPYGVTAIGIYAFAGCSGLQSIDIPESVSTIYERAFSNCTSLETVKLPNEIIRINNYVFSWCKNLRTIVLPNKLVSIGESAFRACSSLANIDFPESVQTIGRDAFSGCESIVSVVLPPKLSIIEPFLFANCKSLTSVTIPNSVTSIGYDAFLACTSISSIDLPYSITSIGDVAFGGCTGLLTITIPENVSGIGMVAFQNCNSLTKMVFLPTNPPRLGSQALDDTNNCPIYAPTGSVDAYKSDTSWYRYKSRIQAIP